MRRSVSFLVIVDLVFLLVASVPGLIHGLWGRALYYLLYAGLIAFSAVMVGRREDSLELALLPRRPMLAVALFAPTVLLTIGISAIVSCILAALGKTNASDVSGPMVIELLRHALLPALLEEMLFRYIPIRLLGRRSPRAAIVVSSVLFALIHLSLFQIPYALVAGAIFAYMTIATGSVLPAMLLHFVNNAISVLWMREPDTVAPIILTALSMLTLPSAVYIVLHRRDYKESLKSAFSGESVGFSFEISVAAALCLGVAALELMR